MDIIKEHMRNWERLIQRQAKERKALEAKHAREILQRQKRHFQEVQKVK